MGALEGIALESIGSTGHKNIVWLGNGIGISTHDLSAKTHAALNEYMRRLTNTLVQARITLDMIFPPLEGQQGIEIFGDERLRERQIDVTDPYGEFINFTALAHETGGSIFANDNFIDQVITKTLYYGLNYYTLSYQPHSNAMDSKFRQIRNRRPAAPDLLSDLRGRSEQPAV